MNRPVRVVPAAFVALALLLAACSGSAPQELLEAAPEAMLEQGTVGYQQGVIVSDDTGEILVDTTTEGAQDLQTSAQRMTVHIGEAQGPADEGAGMTGGEAVEVILDGTLAYVHSPQLQALAGVEWARFDLTETAELLPGFDAASQQQSGPVALLDDLRGAVDDVEEIGEEEVRGVGTTHLRVSVDVQRAIDNAPEERRDDLRAAAEALGVPDRYPMEIWIDDDALPRRIVTVIETEDDAFGRTTREIRTDLFDYGEPVDVTPPDPDDVVDFADLLSVLGGAGAGS